MHLCQLWDNKRQIRQEQGKLAVPSQAGGEFAADLLRGATKGLFNLGRKGVSNAVKSNYAKQKIKDVANKYLDQALDSFTSDLSKKLDPFSGKGMIKPYCGIKKVPSGKHRGTVEECIRDSQIRFYGISPIDQKLLETVERKKRRKKNDLNKLFEKKGTICGKIKKLKNILKDEKDKKKIEQMKKEGKELVEQLKEINKEIKENTPQMGGGIDIHKAILKVAPKKGFVMPGHKYTGPGNPLEQQLRYDPNTGQILEIYQQPTGKTDAVSMQHDVDYTVCGNKPKRDQVKCKNDADRKMVKALDAIPWKDRQWGHAIARNTIATKSKLGMGAKPKNGKSRRVK